MKQVTVVAAVIIHNNQVLCVQRNQNKYSYISEKYEFPGGKIEAGETEIEALQREISEELDMEIQVQDKLMVVDHAYPDFALTMHTYVCASANREVVLHEHIALQWLDTSELPKLDWAAADIPIVTKLTGS
jgi:8-oxo-dGTP diphosphatase